MANGLIKFDSLGMERQADLFELTHASAQRFSANRLTLTGGIPCQERLPRRLFHLNPSKRFCAVDMFP